MIALAASGLAEGSWLRAERQSSGRGRMGRAWQSPTGNLYASTLIRLRAGDPPPATLALVAGVVLAEIIQAYAPRASVAIKWPNDILIGGAKLAGILLERAGDAIVIGIGVNLAHHPENLDRAVTSLLANGADVHPQTCCEEVSTVSTRWVARWRSEGIAPVRAAWLKAGHPIGTALAVHLGDGESIEGLFDGLSDEGALRLRLADGAVRVIHAGDVFLI